MSEEVVLLDAESKINPAARTGALIFEAASIAALDASRHDIQVAALNYAARNGLSSPGVAAMEPPYPVKENGEPLDLSDVGGAGKCRYRIDVRVTGAA